MRNLLLVVVASMVGSALAFGLPEEVDVLVVGGTAKGIAAATAASRAGAKTYLVTPYSYLGEDLAGTLELGLEPGAKPTLPLTKKLWSGQQGLAPFDYWPDHGTPHPRAVFKNDWWERLSEPGRPNSPTDGVYYEDNVVYRCALRKPAEIARVEVIVFEKKGSSKPTGHDVASKGRNGNAATEGVICRFLEGPRANETLELKRMGTAFDVEGDQHYRGVTAVRFAADIGSRIHKVELTVRKSPEAHHQYVARIWFPLTNPKSFSTPPSPLKAKRVFDAELIGAGVGFMTSTAVRRTLRGKDGIVGVEVVNRSGRSVIRAKRVVDATRFGVLDGPPASRDGEAEFSRIVIAADGGPAAKGVSVEKMSERFPISHLKSKDGTVVGEMYRCTMKLAMKDFTYPSFAAAEWEARERTWVGGTLDDADLLVWKKKEWTDLESRIRAGEQEGVAAAKAVRTMAGVGKVSAKASPLPLWGEYDVVVVGGGTSGTPAAIAAARAGAKVLLVEYLSVLGGVGTDGMILGYYDGNHCGFTEEFKKANNAIGGRFGLYKRAETWRKWCREAGVTVWLGAMGVGATTVDGKVAEVEVATELGCGRVQAKCFIDATGNSDVAAAAGAETVFLSAKEFALQSAGQAPHRLGRGGINSDFGYLDDSNAFDLWLFGVRARAGAPNAWDIAKMPDSRERRRIVPDYAVNAQDVTARRPFPDVVVQARSRQDSHGYLADDFRFLSSPSAQLYTEKGERRWKYDVNVPLRSLLPKGISGLAVIGIASGCARDVLPMVRMQADLMNMGYSVGTAAAMAAKNGGEFRKIDFAALRQTLVERKILREETLGWTTDTDVSSDTVLAAAVKSMGPKLVGSDVVFREENRARAIPLLRDAYAKATTSVERQNYAKMLGFLGDATGAETLAAIVSGKTKIEIFENGGAFGSGAKSMDGFMIALGRTKAPCALEPLLARLGQVKASEPVTAVRGVCLSLEALGAPAAAPALAAVLRKEGNHGFAVKSPADLPPQGGYGLGPEMDNCVREIGFARALWACGDHEGVARRTLEAYAADPRGVLSAHAKAILATRQ